MTNPDPLQLTASLDRPFVVRGQTAHVHLVAELTAPASPVERPPLHLVLALDTSGSMEGEKLRHVIGSVELVLQHLKPHDRVGLVAFSHAARSLLPLGLVEPDRARHALRGLAAAGGTNVEAGLRLAASLLGRADAEARRAVLLLSDGQPNGGAMTPRTLAAVVRELGLSVSTLGYGTDHAEDVLAEISEAGRGAYAYVPSPELCRVEVARAVGVQAEIVAEGVTLCIEPRRGVTIERVLGAPTVGGFGAGGALEVPLPDFLAAERRPVAFALKLEPYVETGPASLVRLIMKQRPAHVVELEVRAEVGELAGPLEPRAHGLRLRCSAIDARARATQLAQERRFDAAKAELERVIAEIRQAPAASNDLVLTELLEQLIDDVALMEQRPNEEAQAAFRRSQRATDARRPVTSVFASALANAPKAKLIIVAGAAPAEVPLTGEMVLGRTQNADLVLPSSGVSRQHTRIVPADGAFWVTDLGSSNGTSVNGVRIASERLRDGDVIQVGPVKLLYREA